MVTCGTITVEPAFDPSLVSFNCSARGTVTEGETEDIVINVTNQNDGAASYSIDLLLNGSRATTITGSVGANSDTSEVVEITFDEPGEVDVELSASAERA